MLKIRFNVLTCNFSYSNNNGVWQHCYTINEGNETEELILVDNNRTSSNDIIIDKALDYKNGYKLVQMENGEYTYISQDETLIPLRYDVASDFNEYGFAMVARDGSVSWINENFEYLSSSLQMIKDINATFAGFKEINDFSNGSLPLSKVRLKKGKTDRIFFFGSDSSIQLLPSSTSTNDLLTAIDSWGEKEVPIQKIYR